MIFKGCVPLDEKFKQLLETNWEVLAFWVEADRAFSLVRHLQTKLLALIEYTPGLAQDLACTSFFAGGTPI